MTLGRFRTSLRESLTPWRSLSDVPQTQHKLINILQTSSVTKLVIPMNEAIMSPAKNIWLKPATATPISVDRKYYVSPKGAEFLFSHLVPDSLVVEAVNQRGKQQATRITPYDKDWKRQDAMGEKAYSSASLQMRIANYTTLLAKYTHQILDQLSAFIDPMSDNKRDQFKTNIKGTLISCTTLQAAST